MADPVQIPPRQEIQGEIITLLNITDSPSSSVGEEPMETVMLEKTIIKLGGLLALGFGEAGAEVIGQNMKV